MCSMHGIANDDEVYSYVASQMMMKPSHAPCVASLLPAPSPQMLHMHAQPRMCMWSDY